MEVENSNGISEIVGAIVDNKPEISEHVIENELRKNDIESGKIQTPEPLKPDIVDKYGRGFDPEFHQMKDGKPATNKFGLLKLKPGKPKPQQAQNEQLNPNSTMGDLSRGQDSGQENKSFTIEHAAKMATALTVNTGCILYGKDGLPEPGEQETLEYSFHAYLQAKGIEDIPPGYALLITLLDYNGRRIVKAKETSTIRLLLKAAGNGFKNLYCKIRGKKYVERKAAEQAMKKGAENA